MSRAHVTENFQASRDQLEKLCDHDDPYIRLAARKLYEHRYGEEVSES